MSDENSVVLPAAAASEIKERIQLTANDGYTSARVIHQNCIELESMMCDIQLTREEIAELARLFPVLPAAAAVPQPCEEWVLREREDRDGVTMDVVLASDPTTVIARDVCVPERVYGDIGSVRRGRAKRIVEAADAFRAGVAAERERCAKIARSFRAVVPEGATGYEHAQGWTGAAEAIEAKIRERGMTAAHQATTAAVFHEIILEYGILKSEPLKVTGIFGARPYRTARPMPTKPVNVIRPGTDGPPPFEVLDLWTFSGHFTPEGQAIYHRSQP